VLQNLLLNCYDSYDTSLPKSIEEVIKQLTVSRREIKRSNEAIHEISLMIKEKERSSKRIFQNMKSLQAGNSSSDKLQDELHLTIINIEKEIGDYLKEKSRNKGMLKEHRKKNSFPRKDLPRTSQRRTPKV